MRDAEEVECPALKRGRRGDEGEAIELGVSRRDLVGADGAEIREQGREAVHREALRGFLRRHLLHSRRGSPRWGDRARACCLGPLFVVVSEEHRRKRPLHVEGDVVGQHRQEHVRADPHLAAVADRADVEVGVERAKSPLDSGEGLVGRDDRLAWQCLARNARA